MGFTTLKTDFSNLILTKLRGKDTEPVSKMYGKSFEPFGLGYDFMINYFKNLQSLIRVNHGVSLILVIDPQCPIDGSTDLGEYLGYASVYENRESDTGDSYAHIPELCINTKYQGFGFSHKMLNMLLDKASELYPNSEWIDLNVREDNDTAYNLYLKHGFKERFRYMMGDTKTIRMAKPLHDDFAFHIYPCYNPTAEKNPGKPDYYTESAKYPVQRFMYYTKKLYGEMIRFNYSIYDDDPSLSKKEVNARAKQDASTLLSAIDQHPNDFKVYCAVTDVSIAGYVIMMKDNNGFWTLIMDHYYDTDRNDLLKLIKFAVKECGIDKDPNAVFETMISRDALRGKCKTKYRSMYTFEDYKDTIIPEPEITDTGDIVEPDTRFTTVQTPLPRSTPQEPVLKGTEFKTTNVVKPSEVPPTVSEPIPSTVPEKPRFSTVPTQVPNSTPAEPPSKTKIYIPPKPVVIPKEPDVPPEEPKIPETTNIPDNVEEPMDIKDAPNVKASLGNYGIPEAEDVDEGIPEELRGIANQAAEEFKNDQEVKNNKLPSMSTLANQMPIPQEQPENNIEDFIQVIDEPDDSDETEEEQM